MSDERFRALATDPRYRLPSRKQAQTAVDSRFKRLFTDDAFDRKASVDRYGRKIKSDTGKKEIRRKFRLEDEATAQKSRLGSDGSDSESDSEVAAEDEDLSEHGGRDLAREGFSGSSSEEESTSEEESADEDELAEETAGQEEAEQVPTGEISSRLAVVNLDWDHIRATDIMAAAQSFAPSGGRIISTVVYPSEFGQERMAREEIDGPPREIFASSKSDRKQDEDDLEDDEDADARIEKRLLSDQAKEGDEFDTAKLRQYQLDRLRYYYAIVTCDNEVTAKTLYDSMDGREYLTTANFFDLRFVPDETSFDDEPREECRRVPEGYKPNDFRTEALTHSKVKLTWDEDDTKRKDVQKRAFSRAEMDENDLQAYIGSDSSDADSVSSRKSSAADRKLAKKEAAKQKMRSLLGLSETASTGKIKNDGPVGDMQITFSTGLSKNKQHSVFENQPQDEASVRERYILKEKERKKQRKERAKVRRGETTEETQEEVMPVTTADGDDPFNDPFFNDPSVAAKAEVAAKKAERQKKREARAAADEAAAGRRAELELLMAGDGDEVRHFDMKDIEKAEKQARKKGKKSKSDKGAQTATPVDEFQIETADPRFKQLFDSHDYAIDPTNPRYKGTKGMKDLLEEGRKKRKAPEDGGEHVATKQKKPKKAKDEVNASDDISGLVARLKKPSK